MNGSIDLVICAKTQLLDPLLGAIELGVIAQRVDVILGELAEAKIIRGVVEKVERVKSADGSPGKCRITFTAPNETDSETIETDWLTDPVARRIGNVAAAAKGHPVTIWKHNAPDPTGKVPQGFRRIIWIEAPPAKGTTP